MTVADAAIPAPALRLVAFSASAPTGALIYLWYAMLWVCSAGSVATVIGRRALGEGSPVLSAASMVSLYACIFGLFLFPVGSMLIGARAVGSKSNNTDAKEISKSLL